MAEKLAPVNDLLKKGKRVRITQEMRESIEECIKMLQEEPVLAFPDFTRRFILTTDASQEALGAVLAQEVERGEKPVAFASRRLTQTEERYSALERELLAIVWAIDHFRPYLYGRKFIVHSDHKPLQWVTKLKENSARVQKWKESLTQYQFEVRYTPGKDNVVADWLSRAHQVNVTTETTGRSGPSLRQFFQNWDPEGEPVTDDETDQHSEGTLSAEERREAMEEVQDVIVGKKRSIIWVATSKGRPNIKFGKKTRSSLRCTVRAPLASSDETVQRLLEDASIPNTTTYIYVGNAVAWSRIAQLWASEKIGLDRKFVRCLNLGEAVTDQETQRDIVVAHHQGKTNHRGMTEMLASLKKRYYWKGMKNTVREIVGKCATCLQTKYQRLPEQVPQEETHTAESPLLELQMDVFTWDGRLWLTMIDTFSKVAMVRLITSKSAEETTRALRRWAQVYGTPQKVTTDGGREFRNQRVQTLLRSWGTEHHVTTAGHPQSHGTVERLHNTLGEHLRVLHADRGLAGEEAMEVAVIGYNHSVHRATGFTPFEILFGTMRLGRDVTELEGEPGLVSAIQQLRENQRKTHRKAQSRLEREKAQRVEKHNLQIRYPAKGLKIGDIVFREVISNRTKQLKRYEGPYKVITLRERNLVTIRSQGLPARERTVHREQLRFGGQAEGGE